MLQCLPMGRLARAKLTLCLETLRMMLLGALINLPKKNEVRSSIEPGSLIKKLQRLLMYPYMGKDKKRNQHQKSISKQSKC